MFRFIHAADLHLDSPLRGLAAREGASPETLLGASRKAFEALIDLAITEAVDFVVIAGDVYDRDWRGYETGLFFRRGMTRLDAAGIPVYLISGNHDAASVITRKLSLPDNVRQFSSRSPETVEPDRWPVAIHGMSFPNRKVSENLVPRYPDPVSGKFNLGLLHTSLAGCGEEHDTYAPCSLAELIAKGYDYWALGHIHQPQVLHQNPWIVFPGNLQGRHIRECGARGCRLVVVDDHGKVADCQWHALDVARWGEVRVDLAGAESIESLLPRIRAAMGEAVELAEHRLLALRLVLEGTTPLHASLCNDPDRMEAEIQSIADDFGEGVVWIERVKLKTRPEVSLEELANRDNLTKVVVETVLGDGGGADFPPPVDEMLAVLPNDLKKTLLKSWSGEAKGEIYNDARTIILERLVKKGGGE